MGQAVHLVCARGRHAVSDAPAGGALPGAVDAALGAHKGGTAGYVPAGLLPAGGAGAAAIASLSTLAAPAGAAQLARGRRRRRGLGSGAAARGRVRKAPGAVMCGMRAAGRRAQLPVGP